MVADKKGRWILKRGVVTPGGTPYYVCSVCGRGGHLYGVEFINNKKETCENCGSTNHYPWEINKINDEVKE